MAGNEKRIQILSAKEAIETWAFMEGYRDFHAGVVGFDRMELIKRKQIRLYECGRLFAAKNGTTIPPKIGRKINPVAVREFNAMIMCSDIPPSSKNGA